MENLKLKRSFKYHLDFFHIWGLCPISITRKIVNKCWQTHFLLISLVHIIMINVQAMIVAYCHKNIFLTSDIFGKINDVIKYGAVLISYNTILIESYAKRFQHNQFWQTFAILRKHCAQLNVIENVVSMPQKFLLAFYGCFSLIFFVELYAIQINMDKPMLLPFWAIYLLAMMMSRIRHLQYICYVYHVDEQITILHMELTKIVEYSKLKRVTVVGNRFNENFNKFMLRHLKWCQNYYTIIYTMSLHVNDVFGWSQLANLLNSFVQLLTDLYWLYWKFFNNITDDWLRRLFFVLNIFCCFQSIFFFKECLCILPTFFIVLLVFHSTNECHLKV